MKPHSYLTALAEVSPAQHIGYVRRVSNGFIEADGPHCTIGDLCEIKCPVDNHLDDQADFIAEVVAVNHDHIILMPLDQTQTAYPDSRVEVLPSKNLAPVGDAFSGRLVDALGAPLDGGEKIHAEHKAPIAGQVMGPMDRTTPDEILPTGLRALDGLLTMGLGQRMGIFAASGVGKTTLLNQLATQVECDRCVVCLVGERGREVETFWDTLSDRDDLDCFSVIAATSDTSAILRIRAVNQALALAEYWRSEGEQVLLLIDSITRFAMALREVGLASGAPPTLRAYTPNVFSALPRIVERCGAAKAGGSITAFMTVLSETDDIDDPIVEVMKSLLDGHILLSRQLADLGHYPAIDVPRSISRQAANLMEVPHAQAAQKALKMMSIYDEAKIMIQSGIYKNGSNKNIDEAISKKEALDNFLQQGAEDVSIVSKTVSALGQITQTGAAHA